MTIDSYYYLLDMYIDKSKLRFGWPILLLHVEFSCLRGAIEQAWAFFQNLKLIFSIKLAISLKKLIRQNLLK